MSTGSGHGRRTFLRGAVGVGTAAAVAGFDAENRTWAAGPAGGPTGAGPGGGRPDPLPHLDGTLVTDPAGLAPYADDFGHLVHRTPWAVLRPGSVADVAAMIGFCGPRQIRVAPRGQGHQTDGQAQAAGGLVVDLGPLAAITVDPAARIVRVGAGAVWSAVLASCLAHGLTPPVFTDYIELSVGGTLSAGGTGGATQRHGAQVDTVVELEVVTGTGEVVRCSATRHPQLFDAARAGLGQVGIITEAVLRLVPAPAAVRKYTLTYPTVAALTAAQRTTVRDGRFAWLEGAVSAAPGGGWSYALEGAAFHDGTPPDDQALIGDLGFTGTAQIEDFSYADFVDDLAPAIAYLKSTGEWFDPHPWFNVFVPDGAVDGYVAEALAGLTVPDIGASGVVLLYPVPTARLRAPLLRVPEGELAFLFAVLRTAAPDGGGALPAEEMIAANGRLFQRVRELGGTAYPVGSIPMTEADWRGQYGEQWEAFRTAKRRFDPHGILTPGQGIFGG